MMGAITSVVLVAAVILMGLGDTCDDEGVRPDLSRFPEFWVCGALLVAVQVAVLARAAYVQSRV